MDEQTFQSELNRAKTMQSIAKEPIEADYWDGYQRGCAGCFKASGLERSGNMRCGCPSAATPTSQQRPVDGDTATV